MSTYYFELLSLFCQHQKIQNIFICTLSLFYSSKYFSGIDSGWNVARINDNEENTFLEIIVKTFTNQESFYIGGNADIAQNQLLAEGFGSDSGEYLQRMKLGKHLASPNAHIKILNI